MLGERHDTTGSFDFDGWCSGTRVGIKEKMVLQVPSENWQCQESRQKKTWVGSLFQTQDAVDEKNFEVAIDVFLNGADMVIEKEDRSDREGVYLGRI